MEKRKGRDAELTCAVTVIEGDTDVWHGGSSSICNGIGAGLTVLAAIPFAWRRKRR